MFTLQLRSAHLRTRRPTLSPVARLAIGVGLSVSPMYAQPCRAQQVVYVSPKGRDAADGSAAAPLQSLGAAAQRVRQLRASGAVGGIRVELAAGDYVLGETWRLTSDDGAPANGSVTYAAATPGAARISGGRRIKGWQSNGDHWTAVLAEDFAAFRDLWINGRRAVRARSPNKGFFHVEQAGPDDHTTFVVTPADLLTLRSPGDAEVAFLHDWSCSRVGIQSIDTASRTYVFANPIGGANPIFAISRYEANPRYFVENAIELFDVPGEWFADGAAHEVHYMPQAGETLNDIDAVAGELDQLLSVKGDAADRPVQGLAFSGLVFSHARFAMPPNGYNEAQACYYYARLTTSDEVEGLVPLAAAVDVERAANCRFENCRFEQLGGTGLSLDDVKDCRVAGCTFRDIGGNGLMLTGDDTSDGNVIEDNLVEQCGATSFGGVGVLVGIASATQVVHNEVRDLPYTGISVGWRWDNTPSPCHDNRVATNHIHHVVQLLSDGGGIYTLGRQPGTNLTGNVIHDIPVNVGRAESNGMFMDEGSTDMVVEGNTIYAVARSPIRFHQAGKNTLKANRLASPPGVPAFQYNAADPADMTMSENQEISDADWRPPAGDPLVEQAGRRLARTTGPQYGEGEAPVEPELQ